MPNRNQIGLVIRSCRESRGYSQEYMADMLDIGQSAYAHIESGKTTLTIDRLIHITEILQLDIHEIIEIAIQTRIKSPSFSVSNVKQNGILYPDTKEVYDQLIVELRNEIKFLKSLIKKEQL